MISLSKATQKYKKAHSAASSILSVAKAGLPDEATIDNLAALVFVFDLEIGAGGPSDHAGQDAGQDADLGQAYNQ
jgi:hypothetical protein